MSNQQTIAFLINAEQFERLDIHPDWLVLTGDLQLQTELDITGRRYIDFWEYFKVSEDEAHTTQAWSLCEGVGQHFAGRVMVDDFDLVEGMRNDLLWAFRASMNAALVLQRVDAAYPGYAWVYENRLSEAMCWDPPEPPTDLFNALAAWVSEGRGRAIGSPAPEGVRPLEVDDRCRNFDPEWLRRDIRFVSYADGVAWAEQGMLVDGYNDPEQAWLVMGERFSQGGMPTQLVAEWLSFPFATGEAYAAIDQLVAEAKSGWRDEPVCIFQNAHLAFLWDSFGRWLKNGVRTFALGKLIARAYRPHAVVTGSDVAGSVRAFTAALRAEDVPVISVDHWGIKLDESHLRHQGARNHAVVCGAYELPGHLTWRPKDVQVRAIGTLRQGMQLEIEREQKSQSDRIKVVIFTSQIIMHGHMITWSHPKDLKASWRALLELIRVHPEWEVIIKPHPRSDHFAFYESAAFQAVPNICMRRDLSIAEALVDADVAMIVNIHTSVLPEILVKRVPVIYLKDAVAYSTVDQMEDGGTVVVDRVEEVAGVIERLVHDAAYRAEVLQRTIGYLDKAVSANGEEALRNLLALVEEVARPPQQAASAAARWVMDLTLLLLGLRYGRLPWATFTRELDRLSAAGSTLNFDELDDVDCSLLGPFFLHLYMHEPAVWPVGEISPIKAAGAVYFKLPAAIRPGWDLYRSCLVLASSQRAGSAGALTRSGLTCMLFLLAPGRFLKRAR